MFNFYWIEGFRKPLGAIAFITKASRNHMNGFPKAAEFANHLIWQLADLKNSSLTGPVDFDKIGGITMHFQRSSSKINYKNVSEFTK
jgi:hypothetical protein